MPEMIPIKVLFHCFRSKKILKKKYIYRYYNIFLYRIIMLYFRRKDNLLVNPDYPSVEIHREYKYRYNYICTSSS